MGVRSPGFEPGSSTWQADVLNQTRLQPHGDINLLAEKMMEDGLDKDTVVCISGILRRMKKSVRLSEPEEVRKYISKLKFCNATKNKYATAYNHYAKAYEIEWKKPYYKVSENVPLIPKSQDVQAIIANSSENYATIFTIEAEIGCSPEELHLTTRDKINEDSGEISITGVKGHGSKAYKLKRQTAEMLRTYLHKHSEEQPFPDGHVQSQMFIKYKKRAAKKLCRPDILKIQLRNLRNYSGERFYKSMPVRDPIGVMQHFRHKKLETTMHYLRAMIIEYEEDENWKTLITTTMEEEAAAVEKCWHFVTRNGDKALYRKRAD
jgi:hypothetical protein